MPAPPALVSNTPPARDYADVKALYEAHRYQSAVEAGKKLLAGMKKGEANYISLLVLVSLAALKCEPLWNASALVREASERDQGKSLVPLSNYGLLQIVVGDYDLAAKLLTQALQIDPADFLSHLGLAQDYALDPKHTVAEAMSEMAKAEAANNCFGLDQGTKWLLIGDSYLVLNEPARALAAFQKAEQNMAKPLPAGANAAQIKEAKANQTKLAQSVCQAAISAGQLDLAGKKLDQAFAADEVPPDLFVLAAAKLCPVNPAGEARAKQIYNEAFLKATNSYLFYRLGRAFGTAGQDRYSRLCYEQARKMSPDDDRCIVAYAGQLARDGYNVMARKQLNIVANRFKLEEPTVQHFLTQGLTLAGQRLLDQADSDWASALRHSLGGHSTLVYKTAYARLSNIKCHCHLAAMQYKMRTQPGVVFSFIPEDKQPLAIIMYDPKLATPAPIWDKIKGEATVEPLPREESLNEFAPLVELALNYVEGTYHPAKPIFSFAPPPLRLMQ
jgi:tetratricopeptide (TPR) repeat protein